MISTRTFFSFLLWTVTHLIMINEWFSIIRSFITNRKAHQECWMTSMTVVTAAPKISPKPTSCDTFKTTSVTHVGVQNPFCRAGASALWLTGAGLHVAATCGDQPEEWWVRNRAGGPGRGQAAAPNPSASCEVWSCTRQGGGWSRRIYCSDHPSATCRIKPNLLLNPNRQMLTNITDSNRLDFTCEPE